MAAFAAIIFMATFRSRGWDYSKKSEIFASTDVGKLGRKSSCADLHVVDKGIPVMEMKGKSTTVLERLLDSSGHTVGLIVVGFDFTQGQESQAAKPGKEIGEELARQIPSKSKLFEAGKRIFIGRA